MRIDEMPAVMHDWPEHTRLTEPFDPETVQIVGTGHKSPVTDYEPGPARPPQPSSLADGPHGGPARLITHPSADDHHDQAVKTMTDQTRLALDALDLPKRGAKAWAYAINYHTDVRQELAEAVARIQHALDLIDIHENG